MGVKEGSGLIKLIAIMIISGCRGFPTSNSSPFDSAPGARSVDVIAIVRNPIGDRALSIEPLPSSGAGMPKEAAEALKTLTIERTGLTLELRVQQHKQRRRLRLYAIYQDRAVRKPWLSHDPADRVSDILNSTAGDVLESDLTDEFKLVLLSDIDAVEEVAASTSMEAASSTEAANVATASTDGFGGLEDMMADVVQAGGEVGNRRASSRKRAAPQKLDPTAELPAGELFRLGGGRATGQRRALAEEHECLRPDCVATRAENAELRKKLEDETRRRAIHSNPSCPLCTRSFVWLGVSTLASLA